MKNSTFRAKPGTLVIGGHYINAIVYQEMLEGEKASYAVIYHYGQTLQMTIPEPFHSHDFAFKVIMACFPYVDLPQFVDCSLIRVYTKILSGALTDMNDLDTFTLGNPLID